MGLLLNGQPHTLSESDVKKYAQPMKFYVGRHFITRRDPANASEDSREWNIPRVCIPNNYYLRENLVRGGNRPGLAKNKVGKLEYFDSLTYSEDGKRAISHPPLIPIGGDEKGHIVVDASNYELNYFLDNHPNNEVVQTNPDHPQYDPKAEVLFCTFVARKVALEKTEFYEQKGLIIRMLTKKTYDGVYEHISDEQVKAMALSLLRGAGSAGISAGVLSNYDNMEPEELRHRVIQMADAYPVNVYKAFLDLSSNYEEMILEWQDLGVLVLDEDAWIYKEFDSTKKIITKVPAGKEAIDHLITYLQQNDLHGKMLTKIKNAADARVKANIKKKGGAKAVVEPPVE